MELANASRHCSVWYRFMPRNLECAAIVECIMALQFNYAWMNISILLCVNKESPGSCNDDQHMAWFPLSEIQQFLVPLFLFDWKPNGSRDQIDNIYLCYTYIFSPSGGVYDGGVYTGGPPYDRTSGGGDHMLYGSTYNTNGSVYNGYTITPLNNNKEFPQVHWTERI